MFKEVLNLWLPNNTNDDTTVKPIHLIDGTVGMGGHTLAALQSNNNVHVLGIDRDASMVYNAKKHIQSSSTDDVSSRVEFHHGSFTDISQQLSSKTADGILIDLGMNSIQISNPTRGFTFKNFDSPLDMRFDTSSTNTSIKASDVVNEYPKSELSNIFTNYADEPYANEIAADIVEWRTQVSQLGGRRAKQGINSTLELRYIIEEAVDKYITLNDNIDDEPEIEIDTNKRYHTITTPTTKPTKQIDKKKRKKFESYRSIWNSPKWLGPKKQKQLLSQYQQRKVRHANHVMRCFQAIRIEVNNELEHIQLFFQQFDNEEESILQIGGRIVVIVFHPGEDLIVRQGMDMLVDSGNYELITPKEEGLRPKYEEVRMNGRSRTARLHAIERVR